MPELDQFQPGFRLVDGTQLNTIVDTVNGVTGGTGAVDGSSVTSAGNLSYAGFETVGLQLAAAAGSNSQANATAITNSNVIVTTVSATTRAVKLPVAVTGRKVWIFNDATTAVKVYPATNGTIGAGATNAVATAIATRKGNLYIARNTTHWVVQTGA